jgi:hypothetical protein
MLYQRKREHGISFRVPVYESVKIGRRSLLSQRFSQKLADGCFAEGLQHDLSTVIAQAEILL